MHDFGVSLRLRMLVYKVKQSIWKGFGSMEPDVESFVLRLKFWLWKAERLDDEMSKGYIMIG